MSTLGIVPARSGSRRLPGKNLATINGKPLVRIAAECGLDALDHVIVSTDSEAIWKAAEPADPVGHRLHWHRRDEALARDETSSMSVIHDVLRQTALPWDVLVLLQPTSPLRTADDVRAVLRLLHHAEAVVSVTERIERDWMFRMGHAGRLRSVAQETGLCVPNGAIFALTRKAYDGHFDWWTTDQLYGYPMPASRSVDIDTADDLAMAQAIAAGRQAEVA